MQIKKKDMKNTEWKRVLEKEYISREVTINDMEGVISLTLINKVTEHNEIIWRYVL